MQGKVPSLFKTLPSTQEIIQLLNLITDGNMSEAEALIKGDALLMKQTCSYNDGVRVFTSVTPLTLACWYLDSRMVDMLLQHLPHDEAKKQLLDLSSKGLYYIQDGKLFNSPAYNPESLINAYTQYARFCDGKDWPAIARSPNQMEIGEKHDQFLLSIGKAQLNLPMHFLQEFAFTARPLAEDSNSIDYSKKVPLRRDPIFLVGVELHYSKWINGMGDIFKPFHSQSALGKEWILMPGLRPGYVGRIVHAISLQDKQSHSGTQSFLMGSGWFNSLVNNIKSSKELVQQLYQLRIADLAAIEKNILSVDDEKVRRYSF